MLPTRQAAFTINNNTIICLNFTIPCTSCLSTRCHQSLQVPIIKTLCNYNYYNKTSKMFDLFPVLQNLLVVWLQTLYLSRRRPCLTVNPRRRSRMRTVRKSGALSVATSPAENITDNSLVKVKMDLSKNFVLLKTRVIVCVCVCERERERERARKKERDSQTERGGKERKKNQWR